jgi:hypothetical protein
VPQMSDLPVALSLFKVSSAALDTSIDVCPSFCFETCRRPRRFVGLELEWASRKGCLHLSLSAQLHGSLPSVHFSHYHCERLQTGDAFRWLVAMST